MPHLTHNGHLAVSPLGILILLQPSGLESSQLGTGIGLRCPAMLLKCPRRLIQAKWHDRGFSKRRRGCHLCRETKCAIGRSALGEVDLSEVEGCCLIRLLDMCMEEMDTTGLLPCHELFGLSAEATRDRVPGQRRGGRGPKRTSRGGQCSEPCEMMGWHGQSEALAGPWREILPA